MDCRDAVGYKILALLCTPFRTDLIDCLPVILELSQFLGQFYRDVQ